MIHTHAHTCSHVLWWWSNRCTEFPRHWECTSEQERKKKNVYESSRACVNVFVCEYEKLWNREKVAKKTTTTKTTTTTKHKNRCTMRKLFSFSLCVCIFLSSFYLLFTLRFFDWQNEKAYVMSNCLCVGKLHSVWHSVCACILFHWIFTKMKRSCEWINSMKCVVVIIVVVVFCVCMCCRLLFDFVSWFFLFFLFVILFCRWFVHSPCCPIPTSPIFFFLFHFFCTFLFRPILFVRLFGCSLAIAVCAYVCVWCLLSITAVK